MVDAGRPSFSVTTSYDADGNVRRRLSTHQAIGSDGSNSAGGTEDYWYKYDALGRFVTTQGTLSGSAIILGNTGTSITYNAAGERASASHGNVSLSQRIWVGRWQGAIQKFSLDGPDDDGLSWSQVTWRFLGDQTELYGYDADGNLTTVSIAGSTLDVISGGGYLTVVAPGTATLAVRDTRDGLGRVTLHEELGAGYSRSAVYDVASRVTSDFTSQIQGADTFTGATTYSYGSGATYANGAVVSQTTINKKNTDDLAVPDTSTTNTYLWWDGAVQGLSTFDNDIAINNTLYTSTYRYDANGHLKQVQINDGRPRSVSFANNAEGQILLRREQDNLATGDPSEFRFYLNGQAIGLIGNNGTGNIAYGDALALRGKNAVGPFATSLDANSGAAVSVSRGYADFDQNFDRLNAAAQGAQAVAERYSVREGDTLASIAQSAWGDASLWYLIAEANPGPGGPTSPLAAGTSLILPAKVTNIHNNAGTSRPQ